MDKKTKKRRELFSRLLLAGMMRARDWERDLDISYDVPQYGGMWTATVLLIEGETGKREYYGGEHGMLWMLRDALEVVSRGTKFRIGPVEYSGDGEEESVLLRIYEEAES
tara:strand:- start:715 stop:1044 length:330 start_codon:yes stop_codon:yes gene_type:complete